MPIPLNSFDLIVTRCRRSKYPTAFNKLPVRAVWSLLEAFDSPEDMAAFEMDAYETVGLDECRQKSITNLSQLFNSEFADAFHKHQNFLATKRKLAELYNARQRLSAEIDKLEALL